MALYLPRKRSNPGSKPEARPGMELDYHLLRGNTGFTACEFIQSSGTNLVVMPSQMPAADQTVFAPALDWIIQVIPWATCGSSVRREEEERLNHRFHRLHRFEERVWRFGG